MKKTFLLLLVSLAMVLLTGFAFLWPERFGMGRAFNGLLTKGGPASEMNLLFEEGLVFDNEGKFIYRFPGVYPRFTEEGAVVMGIAAGGRADGIIGIVRREKNGTVSLKSDASTHHDLTVDQDGNIYLLKGEAKVVIDGKEVGFGQIVKIDSNGKVAGTWSLGQNLEKISKKLNHKFSPKDFRKITDAERVLGRRVGCGGCFEGEHLNSLQALPHNPIARKIPAFAAGNILLGLPLNQHLLILDRDTFEVVWSLKMDRVAFFHTPHLTEDDTILVFVNAMMDERGRPIKRSLILEIDPVSEKTIWSYELPEELYSPIDGSAVKLLSGNYLFSVVSGVAREIDRNGKTVWEWRHTIDSSAREIYRIYRLNEREKEALMEIIELGS